MKRFAAYWLPPLVWMAMIFPVGNKALSSSLVYEIFVGAFKKIFPDAGEAFYGISYIIFRKSLHFLEYGILAFLLYRALRGRSRTRWSARWALSAGAVAVAYGFLDEFLQSFVPNRYGSPIDWGVDAAGIGAVLGTKFLSRKKPSGGGFVKALFLKRPFDIALSFIGLLLSSPFWLLFSLLIWLQDHGPVFYEQERVGKGGRIFKALKFRSMIVNAEKDRGPVQAVENDSRVTKIGRILRATAMDELPQLWNIFKGDMSFVGPRALRPDEKEVHGNPDERAIEEIPGYHQRHAIRPGLTGLTQVYLPGDTPRRKKFRYDLLYVRKRSFWLDLKLIGLSFWITFRGKWESRANKV
jgi:lipopolysaccharide/colanic/teichoic acid biosynthesis glycosyltransferase/VanZ family protein